MLILSSLKGILVHFFDAGVPPKGKLVVLVPTFDNRVVLALKVVQSDQTSAFGTSIMLWSEEVR